MTYKDNKRANTAEELRRMFNLDGLSSDRKAIQNNKNSLTKVESEQNNILKSIIISIGDNLESQSDISLWFFSGTPTLENVPYTDWNDKEEHLGDLYYDKETGYVYLFEKIDNEYTWTRKYENDLIQAMSLTNAELDTTDNVRQVFFTTPIVPYDNGDWYVKDGDLYICQISKGIGETYEENDFIIAPKYTDDTKANEVAGHLTIVAGQVTTIIQSLDLISQRIEDNRYYIDEQGNKKLITQGISELNQSVDNIESRISSVADFSHTSSGIKTMQLTNCLACNLLELHIYGNNEVFETLYLSDDLYLSDNLYLHSGESKLAITNENGQIDIYDLGIDEVLRRKNDIYDEYINENGKAKIIRRIDSDGEILEEEQIEELPDLMIYLLEGTNTIILEEYSASIEAKYVLKSDFSEVYPTRIEMNSSIKQSADSINLEVNKKVDNSKFIHAEIVARINDDTSEVKIKADKLDVDAIATFTNNKLAESGSTTINGSNIITGTIDASRVDVTNINASNITSGTISASKISGGILNGQTINGGTITGTNITTTNGDIGGWTINNEGLKNNNGFYIKNTGLSNVYTMSDILIMRLILQGTVSPASGTAEFRHYDLNNDGVIDSADLLLLRRLLLAT